MALPAGVTRLGTFKGDKGETGDTGTLAFATAESVPAGDSAAVEMLGPVSNRGAHFKIPRGLPGVNAVPADEAVAQYLDATDSATGIAFRDMLREISQSVNASQFGAIGDGVVDDTAALNAAIVATPDGGRLIIPAGTYRLTGTLVLPKSISVDATGAVFVQTTGDSVVTSAGEWDAPIDVTATSVEQTVEGTQTVDLLRLEVSGTAPYAKGDIVKLFGDDPIPGTVRDVPSPLASVYRVGQFFSVFDTGAGFVRLRGLMRDQITLGIKVAKLNARNVEWRGGKFTSTYDQPVVGVIRFSSLVNPTIRGVEIQGARGQMFSFVSCFGYNLINAVAKWAVNDEVAGYYGYVVDDNSSEFGYVEGLRAFQPRSGYTTTSTPVLVGNTNPATHGRPYGSKIVNSVVEGCSSTAFDSHSMGERVTFMNCLAVDSVVGFQLRGRNNRIFGCETINGTSPLKLQSESSGGESYGHVVDGFIASNPSGDAIQIQTRTGSSHPNYNVRDPRRSYLRNVLIRQCSKRALYVANATVQLDNVSLDCTGVMDSTRHLVRLSNSRIVDSGKIQIDTTGTTAGAGSGAVIWSSGGSIEAQQIRIEGDSAIGARVARYITGDLDIAMIQRLIADYMPGEFVTVTPTAGTVNWETIRDGRSNRGLVLDNLSASNVEAIRTTKQDITLICTTTSNQTLGNLPNGTDGQMLRLLNLGSANMIVNHGSGPNTTLTGGTSKTIAPGSTMLLIYRGTWRQVATV